MKLVVLTPSVYRSHDAVAASCRYMSSLSVILLYKHLLSYYGFHMPVCLALLHMMACVVFGSALQVSGVLPVVPLQSWNERVKACFHPTVYAHEISSTSICCWHLIS